MINQQTGFGVTAHGLTLAPALGQFTAQLLKLLRRGGQADAHAGAGGVEHIDGFVRELTPGQITSRQLRGGHHRVVTQINTVALFIHVSQATQNGHRLSDGRLVQLHRLKTPGQRRVFFEVFFVLTPRGGGNGAQLATGQCGLEQVGRIGPSGVATGADQGVGFVDKQNDRLGRGFDFVDDAF